ncbi:MAG: hypothetical protein JXR94_01585 [Candidatus Hydrogenedentes bacterium]|nr:hypothetical protein [Candidatus Hydrogenedentota bacterium]
MSDERMHGGLLIAYADGDLDAEQAADVEKRLAASPADRRAVDEYRASLAVVVDGLAPAPAGRQASMGRLRGHIRRRRAVRLGAAAVAAAALALCVHAGLRTGGQSAPADEPATASVDTAGHAELAALEERIAELERQLARVQAAYAALAAAERPLVNRAQCEREEVAAICVAAARNIEERKGDMSGALARYRYAAEKFPETAAASQARERIAALSNDTI